MPHIAEGHTMPWPKGKGQKDKQWYPKTKNRATLTPLRIGN